MAKHDRRYRELIATLCLCSVVAACGDEREPKDPFVVDETDAMTSNSGTPDMGTSETDASETADATTTPPTCDGGLCELTCDELANPEFCWNVGYREAYECTRDASVGTMTSGGNICSASVDGSIDDFLTITFADPVTEGEVIDRELWEFTIARGADDCVSFVDDETGFLLSTASGDTEIEYDGLTMNYSITCPNGDVWQTSDIQGIFGCQDSDGNSTLPGTGVTEIGSRFDYQLLPSPRALFSCEFVE